MSQLNVILEKRSFCERQKRTNTSTYVQNLNVQNERNRPFTFNLCMYRMNVLLHDYSDLERPD